MPSNEWSSSKDERRRSDYLPTSEAGLPRSDAADALALMAFYERA
jgi:hypothetical protein